MINICYVSINKLYLPFSISSHSMAYNKDENSLTKGNYVRLFTSDPDKPWGHVEEGQPLLNGETRRTTPLFRRMPKPEALSTYNESRFQKTKPKEDSPRW